MQAPHVVAAETQGSTPYQAVVPASEIRPNGPITRPNLETPISNQGMGLSVEGPSKKLPELDLSTQIAAIHEFNQFCKIMSEYKAKDDPRFREDGMAQMALAVWEKKSKFFSGLDSEKWSDKAPSKDLSIQEFSDGDRIVVLGVLTRKLDEYAYAEGYERVRINDRIPRHSLAPSSKKPGEFDLVVDEEVRKEKKKEEPKKSTPAAHAENTGDEAHEEQVNEQTHASADKRAYSYRTQPPETPEKKKFRFSLIPEKKEESAYQQPMEFGDLVRAGYLRKLPGIKTPGSLPPTEQRYVGAYAEKINFLQAYSPRERARMIIDLQNTEIDFREQITGRREKINPFYRDPNFARDDLHRLALGIGGELEQLMQNEGGRVSLRRKIELRQLAYERAVKRKAGDVVDYMLEQKKAEGGEYNRTDLIKTTHDLIAREKEYGTRTLHRIQLPDGTIQMISNKAAYDQVVERLTPEKEYYTRQKEEQEKVVSKENEKLTQKSELESQKSTKETRQRTLANSLAGFLDSAGTPYQLHIDADKQRLARDLAAIPVMERGGPRNRLPNEISDSVTETTAKYMQFYNEQQTITDEISKLDTQITTTFPPAEVTAINTRITDAKAEVQRLQGEIDRINNQIGTSLEPETIATVPENVARREFIVGSESNSRRFTDLLNQGQRAMYSPEQRRDALGSFRNLRRALAGTYDVNDKKNLTYEVFGDRILISNLVDALGVNKANFLQLGLVEQTQNQLTGATQGEFNSKTGKIDFDSMSEARNKEVIGLLERYLLSRMQQLTPEQNAEIIMAIMKERLTASSEVDPLKYAGNEYRDRVRLKRREVRPVPIAPREVPKNPGILDLVPNT